MCYFITAYTQEDFCTEPFVKTCSRFEIMEESFPADHIVPLSRGFFFTGNCCDCDSPIGSKGQDQPEVLSNYVAFFKSLSYCENSILLLKHWYSGNVETESICNLKNVRIHVDELDERFLLNIEDDVLYEIGYSLIDGGIHT